MLNRRPHRSGARLSGTLGPLPPGIRTRGLAKRFGSFAALRSVDIEVDPGEVVALLGPNGAGKSTLMRILATTMLPDAGQVLVGGFDAVAEARSARAATGLMLGEERSFFWRLTGTQNLEFFAALHGLRHKEARQQARSALNSVGLEEAGEIRVDRYSTGMRARLGIARALIGEPSVLLLDEPTRSLDPIASMLVRRLVLDLVRRRSVSVLFATHDLHEAAEIASRVVILVKGQVAGVATGQTDAVGLEQALLVATA